MIKYGHVRSWILLLFALSFFSCAPARMKVTYVDEAYRTKPVSDILVIGVGPSEKARKVFEDRFVERLKAAGLEAVSSADVIAIPPDLKLEKEAIEKAVRQYENDAVLITHLVDIGRKDTFSRSGPSQKDYFSYYGYIYQIIHDPGYGGTKKMVSLETSLYDVKTEKRIWSAESMTWETDDQLEKGIDEVISLVIQDLQKQGLIAPK
jgi:hypothetical protein